MTRLTHLRSLLVTRYAWIIVHCTLIITGLILVTPLLQPSPLCTDDGSLHIYRTVALDRALNAGLLYPRWFPDLAYGYGFPFFVYREPLGYYALEAVHLLGLSFPFALNLVLAAGVIASGLTMLWWVSDIFDRQSGFVAGIVYMAAPYLLIDSLTRANLPEVIALALMPLILWAFRRLIVFGKRRHFALAILSYAALLLTHNISSLIFTPVLMAYCALLVIYRPVSPMARSTRYSLLVAFLAMLISLAITAFFWLPALLEGQYAQLYLTHSTRGNDYHFNFLSLGEIFGGPGPSDPALLNPPLRIALGWVQIVFVALGGAVLWRRPSREQRTHIVAALIALVGCLLMALPVSLPLWDSLPLIRFAQFPWRFVGRAVLPAALLAGAFTSIARRSSLLTPHSSLVTRHSSLAPALHQAQCGASVTHHSLLLPPFLSSLSLLLALVALISSTSWLYPRVCPVKDNLSITDVFAYEHSTGHIGVDPLGAYLPVAVQERPDGSPLEPQYASGGTIRRFDRSTLPGGAQLAGETYSPNHAVIDLDTPVAFRATYLTFDFPGWQVRVDGQPAPITPSQPSGLITFDVPAGAHHIDVSFGSTPIRTLADALSVIAVIALAISLLRLRSNNSHADSRPPGDRSASVSLWLIVIPVGFFLIKSLLIDPQLTPLRQTRLSGDQLNGISHPLRIDFGDQLRLLGYDISPGGAPSGETVRVDLYWRALRPLTADDQMTVGLVDDRGEMWSPKTLERPRDYQDYPATTTWPPEAYVVDSFELPIKPGTPPGRYSIFAEVFTRGALTPLPAHASAIHPASRPAAAIIGLIDVARAVRTFNVDQLGIYNFKLDRSVTPDMRLLGLNVDRSDVTSGETVLLTAFWQAAQKPAANDTLTIELRDRQNDVVTSTAFPLGGDRYPSSQWNANEQIVDLDRVRVPASLPTGVYHWHGSIAGAAVFDLGELRVTAPVRSFEMPPIANRIDQTLGNRVTLLGYEMKGQGARGREMKVTLYWRADKDMDESYKVFVQLLDANSQVRAQVDAIPVNSTRPTMSWLPGEIITDVYSLSLPADLAAGQYRLVTGLYNEGDNQRLKSANGDDAIDLTTFSLQP